MDFPTKLIRAVLVRRYKRFLADMELENGEQVIAHCANPGAMEGLVEPGISCWLSKNSNPKRKLAYSWELAQIEQFGHKALVGINTSLPNMLAMEALEQGRIAQLAGYDQMQREVPYGQNSRIDILLSKNSGALCYVEVKNVHLLRQPGLAEFPDCVTKRGAKHLDELQAMVKQGHRAVMLYVIQRDDAQKFAIAADKDPRTWQAFQQAKQTGVQMIAYDCQLSTQSINIKNEIVIQEPCC